MLQRYETLMLATPEITQDESKNLEIMLDREIRAAEGSLISFDRWGKYRLAYPVKKNDYGVYFLVRFEVDSCSALFARLKELFTIKLNDVVMRHVVTNLEQDASLEYQRPKSLEEAPVLTREQGSGFGGGSGEGRSGHSDRRYSRTQSDRVTNDNDEGDED